MRQTKIEYRPHGGKRRGAGRKPRGEKAGVSRATRPQLSGREPVLVTMKMLPRVWNLRTRRAFGRVFEALVPASERYGARIVHYSVQRDHIHLVTEARSSASLSRAMQGLAVRVARKLNRMMGRRGKVFADRFHGRVLGTPRQVRHALGYVLCNARKHGHAPRRPGWMDPLSSADLFDGWRGGPSQRLRDGSELAIASPRTWLLRIGWRRAGGSIDPDHRPGG